MTPFTQSNPEAQESPGHMENPGNRKGKLVIITAPSGAGKTTIVRHLLKKFPELAFSVSATTRQRRTHEVDGKDYYFLAQETFERRMLAGDFLETEEVYPGTWYGTLRMEVERLWRSGHHVIFDVDVQGARNLIRLILNKRSVFLFLHPPCRTWKGDSDCAIRKARRV